MTSVSVTTSSDARPTKLSPSAIFMMGAVFIFGALAAERVSAGLWFTTALILIVVSRGAREDETSASPRREEDLSVFPPSTRRLLMATRAHLTSPDAQYLMKVVVEGAAPLLVAMADGERNHASRRDVVALVEASCALGEELNRMDAFLAQPQVLGDARSAELRSRCKTTRTQLADQLTEACTAIETLHAQLLEERSDAADRVAELAAELTEEARVRHAAASEIDEVLK